MANEIFTPKIRFYHSFFIGKSIKKKENITAEIINEKTL